MSSHPTTDSSLRAQPLADMPGPRWDRKRAIYPTSLQRYLECPRRCRLEYVERVKYTRRWSRPLQVGNALHEVMERIANTLHGHQPPVSATAVRAWLDTLLPAQEYADQHERVADIDRVLEWAERGRRYITHGNPTILRVEKHYPRNWSEPGALGKVQLGAKADLVIRRKDRKGRYVEIVDYKTGHSRSLSRFTPILSAIALKPRIAAALPEQSEPRVVFSYLRFAHGERDRIALTRERKQGDWDELRPLLIRMVNDESWPMHPAPQRCSHCPYFNRACFPTEPDMRISR